MFTALVLSPFTPFDSLRHLAASTGCATTRGLELAPAVRGKPGYWGWNDQDDDGVACESLPSAQADFGLAFSSCADAYGADAAPVRRGHQGYGRHLDADGDGVGCEWARNRQ
ncbi:excalibur calcium-binding domain-containing protein [Brevundimonas sp. M20]|uniref:excalibur calcium-binding domain-containing protein n=1 Tax=Brevundimonas sp. M20 TaxID=2591463 RepID=UPI0011472A65|nr:excalibur calcium-binding domain-containing protein [Brevundimonas sp. M20]